jgi:ssDNA-binding Zn-finger/Zn-ribbon topoisomerase 1
MNGPTRLVLDRDCPQCNYPAVNVSRFYDGSRLYECASPRCDWSWVGHWIDARR